MEKFKEYSNILSVKRKRGEYSNIEKEKIKNKIIQSVGSYENYKIYENAGYDYIDLYESEIHTKLKKTAEDNGIDWTNDFFQSIVSTIMGSVFSKMGIEKHSLIWYMLSWGLIDAVFETWDELIKTTDEKPANWCSIFAKGATNGITVFLANKGSDKVLRLLGFNVSSSENSLIKNNLLSGITTWLTSGTLDPLIEEYVCQKGGLWDQFIEEAGGLFSGGLDAIGSFLGKIGQGTYNTVKNIF